MIRTAVGFLGLLILLPALRARDKTETPTPAQQYQKLVQEYEKARLEFGNALANAAAAPTSDGSGARSALPLSWASRSGRASPPAGRPGPTSNQNNGAAIPTATGRVGRNNPWALHAIAERLLEAAQRGLWEAPSPDTLEALRATLLDSEAMVEARSEVAMKD